MLLATHAPFVEDRAFANDFRAALGRCGVSALRRGEVRTVQVNVGKYCNQACRHCHVEAGPTRTERMSPHVAARVVELLERTSGLETLDITGGAPELDANFRTLVVAGRRLGLRVIDRCNLTVMGLPGQEDLAEFLAAHRVEIVASLPCYEAENVEAQRGRGVFASSISALRRLNDLGYGASDDLPLDLVYNPLGPSLPPPQDRLEEKYRDELRRRFGITFRRLYTITNMPVGRFADSLRREGRFDEYMALLVEHFNPATVDGLMCRSLVSVGWDGRIFDCDFNQMIELGGASTIWEISSFADLADARIATARHCFGCTAGAGSSCVGSIAATANGRS